MDRVLLQPQPAVARHRLGDVDEQRVRDGVAAVLQQRVDHLLGVVAGGAGVPEPERRQPVGVDVLRRPLELGERRDRLAAVRRALVVDLEQQRLVGLDDEGSVIHCSSATAPSAGPGRPRRWPARSSGRSSSAGTGWARCRRRRWCTVRPRRCRAGAGRGRRPGSPGRAAPRRRAARRPTGSSTRRGCAGAAGRGSEIWGVIGCRTISSLIPSMTAAVSPAAEASKTGLSSRWNFRTQHAVAVGALGQQPLAVGEMGLERVDVGNRRVEEPGRPLGVADEVHCPSLRVQPEMGLTAVIRWTANVRTSSERWSWAVSTPPSTETGSTTRSLRVPWLST